MLVNITTAQNYFGIDVIQPISCANIMRANGKRAYINKLLHNIPLNEKPGFTSTLFHLTWHWHAKLSFSIFFSLCLSFLVSPPCSLTLSHTLFPSPVYKTHQIKLEAGRTMSSKKNYKNITHNKLSTLCNSIIRTVYEL